MHIDSIYDLEQRSDTYNSLRKDEAETDSRRSQLACRKTLEIVPQQSCFLYKSTHSFLAAVRVVSGLRTRLRYTLLTSASVISW